MAGCRDGCPWRLVCRCEGGDVVPSGRRRQRRFPHRTTCPVRRAGGRPETVAWARVVRPRPAATRARQDGTGAPGRRAARERSHRPGTVPPARLAGDVCRAPSRIGRGVVAAGQAASGPRRNATNSWPRRRVHQRAVHMAGDRIHASDERDAAMADLPAVAARRGMRTGVAATGSAPSCRAPGCRDSRRRRRRRVRRRRGECQWQLGTALSSVNPKLRTSAEVAEAWRRSPLCGRRRERSRPSALRRVLGRARRVQQILVRAHAMAFAADVDDVAAAWERFDRRRASSDSQGSPWLTRYSRGQRVVPEHAVPFLEALVRRRHSRGALVAGAGGVEEQDRAVPGRRHVSDVVELC